MDRYLSPGLRHLPRLETWPTVIKGAEVLAEGINRGLRVGVWGDYDVDGITATALLVDFFRCKGVPVCFALPDRFEDGYGLTSSGVEASAAQGVGVLLTVDCGIADGAAIARARELGMLVVVSDHHLPGPDLPPAQAIVDPVLEEDCSYAGVAGVGVAFLLMAALNRLLPGEPVDVRQSLDLVALGTIADVVPLTGVNRILVKNGLLVLGEGKRPGIFALKEVSKLPPPLLWAVGRLDSVWPPGSMPPAGWPPPGGPGSSSGSGSKHRQTLGRPIGEVQPDASEYGKGHPGAGLEAGRGAHGAYGCGLVRR